MATGRGITRRDFIKLSIGTVGAGTIASGTATASNGNWPTFGHDEQNRHYNPDSSLDGDSASERWMLSIGDRASSGIPVIEGEVYFSDSSGLVYRVTEQGNTTTYDQGVGSLPSDLRLPSGTSTPTVTGGQLFVGGLDSHVYAIERDTGDTTWSFEADSAIYTSPTVIGDHVYVASADGTVYSVTRDSGDESWRYQVDGMIATVPCSIDDVLAVATRDGAIHIVDIATGEGTVALETDSEVFASPVATDGDIYSVTQRGAVYAIDSTGGTVQWEAELDRTVTRTPALTDDRLYVGTEGGTIVAIDIATGDSLWETAVAGEITTGPVVTTDIIAAGTANGTIHAHSISEGEPLWTFDAGNPITTPLSVADDVLYFGTENGSVYAITSSSGIAHTAQTFADSAASQATATASEVPSPFLWISGGIGTLVAAGYTGRRLLNRGTSSESSTTLKGSKTNTMLSGDAPPIRDNKSMSDSTSKLLKNDVSYSDFDIKEQLGAGGSADVHKAQIMTDGTSQTVALKTPRTSGDNTVDASSFSDFFDEAELWDSIDDHDRIVTVHAWGETPLPWIAMEYMEGGTLHDNAASLSVEDFFVELEGISEALHHAHRHGITHTDIKPANILFTESPPGGIGKLTDWGLANVLLDHSMSVHGLTPDYSAPEQVRPEMYGGTDDRTDIYQLGVVAYELFTGELPYDGASYADVVTSILDEDPPLPSELNPELPSELNEVLLTAIAQEKSDRYETALHFRDDLRRVYHST